MTIKEKKEKLGSLDNDEKGRKTKKYNNKKRKEL